MATLVANDIQRDCKDISAKVLAQALPLRPHPQLQQRFLQAILDVGGNPQMLGQKHSQIAPVELDDVLEAHREFCCVAIAHIRLDASPSKDRRVPDRHVSFNKAQRYWVEASAPRAF